MPGFRLLGQSSEILSTTTKGKRIQVEAEETIMYEMDYEGSPWKGEIKSTDIFQLEKTPEGYKIVDLVIVKQF